MTNDLPDALIKRLERELIAKRNKLADWQSTLPSTDMMSSARISLTERAIITTILQALDLSGIINDLRFYGDGGNYKFTSEPYWDENTAPPKLKYPLGYPNSAALNDRGQRARTRLSKMGVE